MNHLGNSTSKQWHLGDPWWKPFRNALLPGSNIGRVARSKPCLSTQPGLRWQNPWIARWKSLGSKRKRGGKGNIAYRIMQDVRRQMGL